MLTDVCCLAETLAPLVEQHTRHSVGLLQDFVLNGSSMGSTITAEHIASAERRSEQSSDNGSPAYVRCKLSSMRGMSHTPKNSKISSVLYKPFIFQLDVGSCPCADSVCGR